MASTVMNAENKKGFKFKKFLDKQAAQGLRMEEVALKLGCSYSTIVAWRYGLREPKGPAKKLIASIYGPEAV